MKTIQIKDDLIDEMDFVASDMEALSRAMEYFAVFNEEMKEKARQLKCAAAILEQWASELEEKEKNNECRSI